MTEMMCTSQYWSITLLSAISKVLEKTIISEIPYYFEQYKQIQIGSMIEDNERLQMINNKLCQCILDFFHVRNI